jgi:hypothetical protein
MAEALISYIALLVVVCSHVLWSTDENEAETMIPRPNLGIRPASPPAGIVPVVGRIPNRMPVSGRRGREMRSP